MVAYQVIKLDKSFLVAKIASYLLDLFRKKEGQKFFYISPTELQIKLKNENIFAEIDEIKETLKILWEISEISDRSLVMQKTELNNNYYLRGKILMMALANSPLAVKHFLKQIKE